MANVDNATADRTLGRDARLRVTGPALRAFFGIAQTWRLTTDEQLRLLGLQNRSTLGRWRRGEVQILRLEALERISIVLGIFRATHVLLPVPDRANSWVRRPNGAAIFGGRSALERMLAGNVSDLFVVRRYLDSEIGRS